MRRFFQKFISQISKHAQIWNSIIMNNQASNTINFRILLTSGAFLFCFFLVGVRLVDIMLLDPRVERNWDSLKSSFTSAVPRGNIVDRNGNIIATNLVTASVYSNTHDLLDIKEAAEKLHSIFPKIPFEKLYKRLASGKSFIWISRHITPKKQAKIQELGLPGIYLRKDYKRVYPYGSLASQVIGFCDIDGFGISGIENKFENFLTQNQTPLKLSLDMRIQHVLHEAILDAMKEFRAIGGNAIVMNVKNGEIIAMESLPSADPNHPNAFTAECLFNRNTLGVNEPGSIFKILNVAIALESGKATVDSKFDATEPVKVGRFTVSDFMGKNRVLTLKESFIYSSNIASIKIAQHFGGASTQVPFFEKFDVFKPIELELPECGKPIYPSKWTEVTTLSSSYGYGIAINPIRLLTTVNGIINDGILVNPTLLSGKQHTGKKVISKGTSRTVRQLMRAVVLEGTAKKADVKGYEVFGKTGTSYKIKHASYANDNNRSRITFFVGGFPLKNPEYIVLFMLDEPKKTDKTFGFASAGWNAAPYCGKIIERIAPILGVKIVNETIELTSKSNVILSVKKSDSEFFTSKKFEKSLNEFLRKSVSNVVVAKDEVAKKTIISTNIEEFLNTHKKH